MRKRMMILQISLLSLYRMIPYLSSATNIHSWVGRICSTILQLFTLISSQIWNSGISKLTGILTEFQKVGAHIFDTTPFSLAQVDISRYPCTWWKLSVLGFWAKDRVTHNLCTFWNTPFLDMCWWIRLSFLCAELVMWQIQYEISFLDGVRARYKRSLVFRVSSVSSKFKFSTVIRHGESWKILVCQPWSEKRGVSKYPLTFGHPVEHHKRGKRAAILYSE